MNNFLPTFDAHTYTVIFRLCLAVLCGGYIGAERIRKKRPAGIKTHAIVALGSALAVITSEYIAISTNANVDATRIAGQVITGVGFLGAGTIMITGRQQITGLTTAAGIWLASCIGIAIGVGFYSGAFMAMLLLLFVNSVLGRIDRVIQSRSKIMNVLVDCISVETIKLVTKAINDSGCSVISSNAPKTESLTSLPGVTSIIISVFMAKNMKHQVLTDVLLSIDGVIAAEEI